MRTTPELVALAVAEGEVSAVVEIPSRARGAGMLLTHGAGGDRDDPGLVALTGGVAACGHLAVRANLPFREAGRAAPPRADRAAEPYGRLFAAVRDEFGPRRAWAAGGKSYGGRVASLAVAAGMPAAGLVFYGYPLHPSGKPELLRVDHWPDVGVPCLFLQGDRDPMCDLALLRSNLTKFPRRATLHVVEGGDHSLRVPASRSPDGVAREPAEVLDELAAVVGGWLDDL